MEPIDGSCALAASRIPDPIAVTGATGFIGRKLVARLLDEGYRVRAMVLHDDPVPDDWFARGVVVSRGDVTQRTDVVDALADTRFVFHLAALVTDWGSAAAHRRVTVEGTRHVLEEASARHERALLVSSIAAYGDRLAAGACDEDTEPGAPVGPYSAAKQAQERIAFELEGSRGLQVTIVRPGNVIGPGSGPWTHELGRQLRNRAPSLIGGGDFEGALVHVDDVVDVLIRAAERVGAVGRTYNASDDRGLTWKRYVAALADALGSPPPKSVPRAIAAAASRVVETAARLAHRSTRPPLTREAFNLCQGPLRVPIDRARRELGYTPRVSFDAAMAGIVEHLRPSSEARSRE